MVKLRCTQLLYSNLTRMKYSMLKDLKCDRTLCSFCRFDDKQFDFPNGLIRACMNIAKSF